MDEEGQTREPIEHISIYELIGSSPIDLSGKTGSNTGQEAVDS